MQGGVDEALQEWAGSRNQCAALASLMDVDVRAGMNGAMVWGRQRRVVGTCRLDVESRRKGNEMKTRRETDEWEDGSVGSAANSHSQRQRHRGIRPDGDNFLVPPPPQLLSGRAAYSRGGPGCACLAERPESGHAPALYSRVILKKKVRGGCARALAARSPRSRPPASKRTEK